MNRIFFYFICLGGTGTPAKIYEHLRKSTNICENLRTSANICEDLHISAKIYEHLRKSTNHRENLRTPAKIYEHLRTSTKIYENLRKSVHGCPRISDECRKSKNVDLASIEPKYPHPPFWRRIVCPIFPGGSFVPFFPYGHDSLPFRVAMITHFPAPSNDRKFQSGRSSSCRRCSNDMITHFPVWP